MEQPEIFTPEAYEAVRDSMQPIYGQTKGLGNKAIVRAVAQALEQRQLGGNICLPLSGKNMSWRNIIITIESISTFLPAVRSSFLQENVLYLTNFPFFFWQCGG